MPQQEPFEYDEGQIDAAVAAFDRRTFLRVMGAALAAGGALSGCTGGQPLEHIVPYVRMPEHVLPGEPSYYATVLPTSGFASGFGRGVIVESHEGRPTKIEGNPLHASSLGGTDIFMQAAILDLYDPDRSRMPTWQGAPLSWSQAFARLSRLIQDRGGAERLRIVLLTRMITSRTTATLINALMTVYPNLIWIVDDPLNNLHSERSISGAGIQHATPLYDFTKARLIVSLDADFLGEGPGAVRYARDWAQRRRVSRDNENKQTTDQIARLYMAETSVSFTGARADHRLPVAPSQLPRVASGLIRALRNVALDKQMDEGVRRWITAAAGDLQSAGGDSLVIPGPYAPPQIHAAAFAINDLLGAVGTTVRYVAPMVNMPPHALALPDIASHMASGQVDLVITLDANPAYTSPGDLNFSAALRQFTSKGGCVVHAGVYADETAALATLHLPMSHALESWGDLRAHDGSDGIMQPLINPLWGTSSANEILSRMLSLASKPGSVASELTSADGYRLVQHVFQQLTPDADMKASRTRWETALQEGRMAATPLPDTAPPSVVAIDDLLDSLDALGHADNNLIELVIRPDPTLLDGTLSNNAWLQELPKPFSRLTWGNVALMNPTTAQLYGIRHAEDNARRELPLVELSVSGTRVEIPVFVIPTHPEGSCTLHLGGGRRSSGAVHAGIGVDVAPLRRHDVPWLSQASLRLLTPTVAAACAQPTVTLQDRDIARQRSMADLSRPFPASSQNVPLSLYHNFQYTGYRWGMIIDLSSCIGCQACVIACQAENNIPVVGREQVRLGREMHWLRIDTYYGPPATRSINELTAHSAVHFLPMLCQHCENAPCEVVCPVEATTHSEEGINEMTYNRCVGTRYCSNNCPYKVRRFNFLHYTALPAERADTEAMQRNPNVTVRSRGVMEKCTYCVQRINRARIQAKRQWAESSVQPLVKAPLLRESDENAEARPLPRLSVHTACQQACPTEAIIFGDLNDSSSLIHRLRTGAPTKSLHYSVLAELNTQPRTTYLARLTNPHPGLATAEDA